MMQGQNFHYILAAITAFLSIAITVETGNIPPNNPENAPAIIPRTIPPGASEYEIAGWKPVLDRNSQVYSTAYTAYTGMSSSPKYYWVPENYKPPIPEGATRGRNSRPIEHDYQNIKKYPIREPGPIRKVLTALQTEEGGKLCPITVYQNVNHKDYFAIRKEVDQGLVGRYKRIWIGSVRSYAQETWGGSRILGGITVRFTAECMPLYRSDDRGNLKIMPGFHDEPEKAEIKAKWSGTKYCDDQHSCHCYHVTKDDVYNECIFFDDYEDH